MSPWVDQGPPGGTTHYGCPEDPSLRVVVCPGVALGTWGAGVDQLDERGQAYPLWTGRCYTTCGRAKIAGRLALRGARRRIARGEGVAPGLFRLGTETPPRPSRAPRPTSAPKGPRHPRPARPTLSPGQLSLFEG